MDKYLRQQTVSEKWGFGMAPPKQAISQERKVACREFLVLLSNTEMPAPDDRLLEIASVVKGLFNRIVREDQWDWFTVCRQLGYPSRRISGVIAEKIVELRSSLKTRDRQNWLTSKDDLRRLPLRKCLSIFIGELTLKEEEGAGWIYVLSSREYPDLLKVGMTTRTVEQRVAEINRATDVAIPFGVRRCWRVSSPQKVERLAHDTLNESRLRGDREFFKLKFPIAARRLDEAIRISGCEIRTLNALSALGG